MLTDLEQDPEYELRWPSALFADEARAVLSRQHLGSTWTGMAERLLEEAFIGSAPRENFVGLESAGSGWGAPAVEPWGAVARPSPASFLTNLAAQAPHLRQESRPRPYYSRRRSRSAGMPEGGMVVRPPEQLRQQWADLVHDLRKEGYLARIAPEPCIDGDERDPDAVISEHIQRAIGTPAMWPPQPEAWDQEVFFDLVEVVHDFMARPRTRNYHSYGDCGWHYGDFAIAPGRALYRWRVNQLLTEHGAGLQLADTGEDAGRLVQVLDDAFTDLVEAVRTTPAPTDQAAVDHAIALFRQRGADRETKRSAVVALARVLEARREFIEDKLDTKDEGALFTIANSFDLRHRRRTERGEYDEAFLDWFFWWYLSTIRLTDRLEERIEPT